MTSKDTIISSGSVFCWHMNVENDLELLCVVLSVCHKVIICLQCILIFRRVEFLCTILLKIFQSCGVNLKCNKFSGKTLRCHYQSLTILQTPQKEKNLVFKGESNNVTIDNIKDLVDFNKINHAEAERMKCKNQVETYLLLKSYVTM